MTRLGIVLAILLVPASSHGQVMTLREVLDAAAANNRAIRSAEIQREKAVDDLRIARTRRLPVFPLRRSRRSRSHWVARRSSRVPQLEQVLLPILEEYDSVLVDVEDGLIRLQE